MIGSVAKFEEKMTGEICHFQSATSPLRNFAEQFRSEKQQ